MTHTGTTAVSYSSGTSSVPLIGETIGANLRRVAGTFPERDAVVDRASGRRLTYAELDAEVDAIAKAFHALGVRREDRVGIWSPNTLEWFLTQYATARIGAVLVTINPAYRSHELEFVLQQAGIRTLVALRAFKTSDYAGMVEQVRGECPALVDVLYTDDASWTTFRDGGAGVDDDVLAQVDAGLDPDQPVNIQYTSGTTGFPKGATLTHHNILNNGFFVGELCGYTEADRVCIPVPFYHCFGMTMGNLACTSHGACAVIPAPAFDPAATIEAVEAERCTSLYGVPTMFIAELQLPDLDRHDLSSLRTGIMAGSPCPVEVMKQVIDRMNMSEVSIAYGMTETSPVSLQTRRDDTLDQRTATVGQVGPHLEVKIVDPETGQTTPRNVPGEVCTRGYSVMLGYWDEPEKTADVLDRAGWMHTGDIGVMDDDGFVAITGRIKDMVIRGGENVYPREIEEFLYAHPDIVDAQVIGVPDQKYGEELMAWVRLRDGVDDLTADAVREFCTGKLAHYKIPRYVHVVDAFPMTVTGKVRKVEMRDEAVKILGLG